MYFLTCRYKQYSTTLCFSPWWARIRGYGNWVAYPQLYPQGLKKTFRPFWVLFVRSAIIPGKSRNTVEEKWGRLSGSPLNGEIGPWQKAECLFTTKMSSLFFLSLTSILYFWTISSQAGFELPFDWLNQKNTNGQTHVRLLGRGNQEHWGSLPGLRSTESWTDGYPAILSSWTFGPLGSFMWNCIHGIISRTLRVHKYSLTQTVDSNLFHYRREMLENLPS